MANVNPNINLFFREMFRFTHEIEKIADRTKYAETERQILGPDAYPNRKRLADFMTLESSLDNIQELSTQLEKVWENVENELKKRYVQLVNYGASLASDASKNVNETYEVSTTIQEDNNDDFLRRIPVYQEIEALRYVSDSLTLLRFRLKLIQDRIRLH